LYAASEQDRTATRMSSPSIMKYGYMNDSHSDGPCAIHPASNQFNASTL